MKVSGAGQRFWWAYWEGNSLSLASKCLVVFGSLMVLACGFMYLLSQNDARTLREVGVWVKPFKFMAATALLAWTTVWLAHLVNPTITQGQAYVGICVLIMVTSFLKWPTSPIRPPLALRPTTTQATLGTLPCLV